MPDQSDVFVFAYPNTFSVLPGESLKLHVSASTPTIRIRIYNLTDWASFGAWRVDHPRLERANVPIHYSKFGPDNAVANKFAASGTEDWKWPQNVDVPIPADWESGIYIAEFTAIKGNNAAPAEPPSQTWVEFVVRNPASAPGNRILYKFVLNTINAYSLGVHPFRQTAAGNPADFNNDFYVNPVKSVRSALPAGFKVTMRRPVSQFAWNAKSITYDYPLVRWIEAQGYEADYCTDVDIHLDSTLKLLSKYPMVVSPGHDEYWSKEMRDNLVKYRDRGGNIAFLSGNTCCWCVHYTDIVAGLPTAFVCDKGPLPQYDTDGPDAFWKIDATRRENGLLGAATRNCAIRGDDPPYNPNGPFAITNPRSPGYRVQNSEHWLLKGTGLNNHDVIGVNNLHSSDGAGIIENLIGYEGNGARITLDENGDGVLSFTDGIPSNFVLLGVGQTMPVTSVRTPPPEPSEKWRGFQREDSPSSPGHDRVSGVYAATLGHYASYGQVFAGSTIHYATVLNAWDADESARGIPAEWADGLPIDEDGHPIMGNPHLHRITRNVFDAFLVRRRNAALVSDVTGDGKPDMLMQADASGELSFWLTDGSKRTASGSILVPAGDGLSSSSALVGIASLTGVKKIDLMIQHGSDRHLECWTLQHSPGDNSIRRVTRTRIAADDEPGDTLKAVAFTDLDGNGAPDVLFQNQEDGSLWYWFLDSTRRRAKGPLVPEWVPGDLSWEVVAAIDLNGDGRTDLLFQNQQDGSLYFWILDGVNRSGFGEFVSPATPQSRVVGCARFKGKPSILFQDTGTGVLSTAAILPNQTCGPIVSFAGGATPWFL
ncbi:MAG: hypothetical protein QOK37_3139 [Thermoanaerobaculia bacterium]|nr:hypothetical protein [Thermoanaerobaculia bacterium]